jgi:hypothetical protein
MGLGITSKTPPFYLITKILMGGDLHQEENKNE